MPFVLALMHTEVYILQVHRVSNLPNSSKSGKFLIEGFTVQRAFPNFLRHTLLTSELVPIIIVIATGLGSFPACCRTCLHRGLLIRPLALHPVSLSRLLLLPLLFRRLSLNLLAPGCVLLLLLGALLFLSRPALFGLCGLALGQGFESLRFALLVGVCIRIPLYNTI